MLLNLSAEEIYSAINHTLHKDAEGYVTTASKRDDGEKSIMS